MDKSARNSAEWPIERRLPWRKGEESREVLLSREFLVTNGLGGYCSSTVSGALTRKYHGMLVAALPAPLGRMVMWSHLTERLRFASDDVISLGGEERTGGQLDLGVADYLTEFRLENGLPVWTYAVRDLVLEKRIVMSHLQNTVHAVYHVLRGTSYPILELRPSFQFRHHETAVNEGLPSPYQYVATDDGCEIRAPEADLPPLRLKVEGGEARFTEAAQKIDQVWYRLEQSRGYAYEGSLWSPGFFEVALQPARATALIGSTEDWEIINVLSSPAAIAAEEERRIKMLDDAIPGVRDGFAAELVFAADQFIVTPNGRPEETARAHAVVDEARTIIAGYHWFTDWGRDTMISLEGLTLVTGRLAEAGYILRTFAYYVRDGLIPNMFPDRKKGGLYHTADATLWFFHALNRYLQYSGDRTTLRLLLPTLIDMADSHLHGTRFNIHVDPRDGLLAQGAANYQLTWMDAKMGEWVVTPRRGKAVEINALWYNALSLLAGWCAEEAIASGEKYGDAAKRARVSFNERFWFAQGGYLYDVIDCDGHDGTADSSCRPNQIFAIALDHPVLDQARWEMTLGVVERELLTSAGLRTLSPRHPDYQPIYGGDLRARDGAYHQGTVWAWLIGPFIDAWLKVHRHATADARRFLHDFPAQLGTDGIGSISEVFDARAPHQAGGCIAQAWSVAEVLRCWVKTGRQPTRS
ncbi:MAG: amylo-alpha-1,6-glucosidase [Verrucomicrobiota bacterium]|nr:amylo-alpha-1,6-glucosidase [Verrucomicrobiota bacterium]